MENTSTKLLKVIPLGGLEEIGKNMTVFEYNNDIIVVDCGLAFPEDEMLGIDLVIPDTTYIENNSERLRGIFVTHGHEDHIGGLPYILKKIKAPIFGTELTLGLIESKLQEAGLREAVELVPVSAGETVELGEFTVEFLRSTHSIADTVMLAISTPVGTVIHTADFKIDHTPIEGKPIDFQRIAELARKGVLLLMSESTNAEMPGCTLSERIVGESFDSIFKEAESRIIVASFASNIHRLQQVMDSAAKNGRKVAICGRSIINVTKTALRLGYLHIPENTLVDLERIKKLPDKQVVIVTTGSQGEPMSALARVAMGLHRQVDLHEGDLVIISASPIPGNEKFVHRVINEIYKRGAKVMYESLEEVHASGHARQEELKFMLRLVKPKYFVPIHGEYRQLRQHADIARNLGIADENIHILRNGQVLDISCEKAETCGEVSAGTIIVDGLGVGNMTDAVIRDRKLLSEDGLIIVSTVVNHEGRLVSGPEVISKGFMYENETDALMDEIKSKAIESFERASHKKHSALPFVKNAMREDISSYLYRRTMRKPMILPIFIEVNMGVE